MEKRHRGWIRARLRGVLPDARLLTLGLPDEYEVMNPELVTLLERLVPGRLTGMSARETE